MHKFFFRRRLEFLLRVAVLCVGVAGIIFAFASIPSAIAFAQTNSAPPTPETPTPNPYSGNKGSLYYFSTTLYRDPEGNLVQAVYDWGDGSPNYTSTLVNFPSGYSGGISFDASHSWSASGTYYIKTKAVDSTGLSSAWSSPATMRVGSPPNPPTVTATANGSDVNLSWTYDGPTNVEGFKIYRQNPDGSITAPGPGNWSPTTRTYTDSNVPIGKYYYYMQAYNGDGRFLSSNSGYAVVTVSVSVAIPAAPSGLDVGGSSPTAISIYWADNSTNESEFKIERRFNGGVWSQIGAVVGNSTTKATTNVNTFATDSSISGAGTYDYRVKACNVAGCSAESNTTSRTIDASAPAVPSGLTATYSSAAGSVLVSWTDNSTGEWGFRLNRRIKGSTGWFGLASVFNNTTGSSVSFTDTYQLATNTTYEYVVRSYNTYESGDSNIVTVSTGATTSGDVTPPSVPTNVSVTPMSTSSILISWGASTDNVGLSVYRIYRNGGEVGWVSTPTLSYTNTGLSSGTSYSYSVAAQDTSNNLSAQSTAVSTITMSDKTSVQNSCGSTTSGGGIKLGIYLIDGRTSGIYGRTDCLADSEQHIQWVTCVESLSGTMFYPQRDKFNYSYTVKDPSGIIVDSGSWSPSWITSQSSCPLNNGGPVNGNSYTMAYNFFNLKPGTAYTFGVSGTNAGGAFSSTAVFRTQPATFTLAPAPTVTSTTPITTSTSTPATSPTTTVIPPITTPPSQIPFVAPTPTPTPISKQTSTSPAPLEQCLQAGGLWCYSNSPTNPSGFGYCAPAKFACERGEPAPRTALPQPPAVGERVEPQTPEQFLNNRRAVLQDLRALERLVRRDIIDVDAKQLKAYKEKILSLKPGEAGDSSVLQSYQEQIINLQGVVSTSGDREPTTDPRLEARALKQLKQGLRLFERHIATLETKVTQIQRSEITVDTAIIETIASAEDLTQRVKGAQAYNDIQDIAEQMPDVGQALNDTLPRLEELLRLSRVMRMVESRVVDGEKAIKEARASAERLKLDATEKLEAMQTLVIDAKSAVVAIKTGGVTKGLLDTLKEQVFDKLDDVFERADHIRTVASVKKAVNQATSDAKRYEARLRRLQVGIEDRQTARGLVGQFKEELTSLKGLSTQKLTADIGDQIIDHLNTLADVKAELEDALGLSTLDATQEQIKRLITAPSEKIKPFKIEQLEQGVL